MQTEPGNSIDWRRVYPYASHRWNMGLRAGNAATFFATRDPTGSVCTQRARWLFENPTEYAALLPEAGPALEETVALARAFGAHVDNDLPPFGQLLALGRTWEPDFVWMHAGTDSLHRLIGGVVCFPSMWALREKIGRIMHDVHGPVPELNATLGRQIEAFMTKQEPGTAWVRENVNFSRDAELNHHPGQPYCPIDATITAEEFWFRFEHQLLLKLPRTRSILFGIRIETLPLSQVLLDKEAAIRLAEVFSTMSPDAARYKGVADARSALIALCSEANSRQ
jgi:hypothetical protein